MTGGNCGRVALNCLQSYLEQDALSSITQTLTTTWLLQCVLQWAAFEDNLEAVPDTKCGSKIIGKTAPSSQNYTYIKDPA